MTHEEKARELCCSFGGHLRDEMNRELNQKADKHEISSLRSNVDSLENTVRELRSEISGLRSELQRLQEIIERVNP